MYRKKRKTIRRHVTHRRHRRVSGIKDIDITQIALVVGGAIAGRILNNKLAASTNTTFSKLAPYSSMIAGIVIPMVSKQPMMKALSMGLIAVGGVNVLVSMHVISGIETTVAGMPYRAGVGYPYNAIPYQKKLAGMVDGNYVSKPNWSGSGKSQANVIGSIGTEKMISGNPFGSGEANPGLY
jgi:hypothetical protein